jgi:Rrf2 family transcriptional regulator, iron-sulfur cluster assembly transcription factor
MRNAPTPPTHRQILSQTAEHALRSMLYLGGRGASGPAPSSEIAAALGTPPNYTGKTLRRLARKGLLRSVRGPHGGFALLEEPRAVSVARLVDAVDDVAERPAVCLLGHRPCDARRPCEAHRRWSEVQKRTHELLERTTLADLLGDGATRGTP